MSKVNKEPLELPSAVLWDWDGTIVDSYGFLNDAHNFTLEKLGFPKFQEGEYKAYFGKPREILYPAIYKEKADQAMDLFQEYVFNNSHTIQILPEVKPVLDFFHSKNIRMGIVSNKKPNFIKEELKHTKYGDYFEQVIGAGDADADKPSSAPLLLALKKMNIDHTQTPIWYVGDTENDLACAKNTGCDVLFLKGHDDTESLMARYRPLISFDNYAQLREILVAI